MPASAEPMANVKVIVLLMSMPISCAAPVSSDTARMALPILVFCTRNVSASIEITDTTMVTIALRLMDSEPN